MRLPFWLSRLLPMWAYICPKCRETVAKNSHECPHCGERFPLAIRVPPSFLKDPKKLEAYVHKHIFPRVDKFTRAYLVQFFTELFSDGFESGDFSAWASTVESDSGHRISVQSSIYHCGSYACLSESDSNTASKYAVAYKTLASSYQTVYMRVYVRVSSLPTSGRYFSVFKSRYSGDSNEQVFVGFGNNDGTLQWFIYNRPEATFYTYNETMSADTWYCLELRVYRHASSGELQLWRDGSSIINESGLNTGNNDHNRVYVGYETNFMPAGMITCVYVDCVVVADAYIGPEEGTLVEVADSLELAETIFRNKTLILFDSLGLADSLYGNKSLLLGDSASLSGLVTVIMGEVMKYVTDSVNIVDLVYVLKALKISDSLTFVDAASTPSRVLKALKAISAADNAAVNKVLQVNETVSIAEIVDVGVGSAKKTRLFLILGDLAVQLTGD